MNFINQELWLWLLATIPLVTVLWTWAEARRRRTLKGLLSPEMKKTLMNSSCGVRRTWKNIFFLCAWLLLIFCVMRPYKGSDKVLRQRTTRDILVLFDVSKSMNVRDCFGQSRMKYGKNWVRKLAKSLELDRFGLMSFSGQAFLECPLTSDFYSFELGLDELSSELAPIGGTDIGEALDQALVELDTGGSHKAVIMLSDGEDISGILDDALTKFKEKGASNPDFEAGFNTPEHKFKMQFGKTDLMKNFGFNVNFRWQDSFLWQSSFYDATIDARSVFDAQVNYRMPKMKSVLKLGGANLGGKEYFSAPGVGAIGSQFYVSWTINP